MRRLASRSPRRVRLLQAAGIVFRPGPFPDVDETPPAGLDPPAVARTLAEKKAQAAARLAPGETVLAADTVVYLEDGLLLGKPRDDEEARAMLHRLSGCTHRVATGVALARDGDVVSDVAVSTVTFRDLAPAEIDAYVAGGEPRGKAGAYGIQGGAASFVRRLVGGRDTVIGLPVHLVAGLSARLPPGRV